MNNNFESEGIPASRVPTQSKSLTFEDHEPIWQLDAIITSQKCNQGFPQKLSTAAYTPDNTCETKVGNQVTYNDIA